MEYGLASGLAQRIDYSGMINDERYHQQQMKQVQAENQARLKAFEDDNQYMNAANSFDYALIEGEAKKTLDEIGKIVQSNPNWESDLAARKLINEKRRYLKSNQHVIRGMASDTAYKEYIKDMQEVAKNPQMHNTKAYQEVGYKWNNYLKYGHQDGEEGLKRDGGPRNFVYTKPRDYVDLNKVFSDAGNSFKDLKQETIKGGGRGAYQEYANPETLNVISNQIYEQNKTQLDEDAFKYKMSPLEYVKKGVDANIKKQRHLGDFGLQDALTLRALDAKDKLDQIRAKGGVGGGNAPTTWETEIKKKEAGVENGEVFDQIFGKEQTYNVTGRDGKPVEVSGYETKHTGHHRYMEVVGANGKKQMQKFVEVYTDLPESVSKEKGFTRDPWGAGDNEIDDKYKGQVSKYIKEGKDGKQIELTRVKTWVPIDVNNQSFRGRYNQMNMANKFQQAPEENLDTTGWTQDPKTGEVFDAQGNKRGTVDSYK